MPTVERSPVKGAAQRECEAGPSNAPPSGKLAAVSRVKHQIEELLHDVEGNKVTLKKLFTVFLTRVENLYEHCEKNPSEVIDQWLPQHNKDIKEFKARISNLLYPPVPASQARAQSVRTITSITSSVKYRLAEEKARLRAQRELSEKTFILQQQELQLKQKQARDDLNLKMAQEKENLMLKQQLSQLEHEESAKILAFLEEEISEKSEGSGSIIEQEIRVASSELASVSVPAPITVNSSTTLSVSSGVPTASLEAAPVITGHVPSYAVSTQPTASNRPSIATFPYLPPSFNAQLSPQAPQFVPRPQASTITCHYIPPVSNNFPHHSTPCTSTTTPGVDISAHFTDALLQQTQITKTLVDLQRKAALPKKNLEIFDGSDITKFKTFLLHFERFIEDLCDSDAEKFHYLQYYTAGKPQSIVNSCIYDHGGRAYNEAKKKLLLEYDNEHRVANAYLQKISDWPVIKADDAKALESFAIFLFHCNSYMENMTSRNPLQSPKEMMHIVEKLPYKLRDGWRRKSHHLTTTRGSIYFCDLVGFIENEASVLNQPVFGNIDNRNDKTSTKKKVLATQMAADTNKGLKFCEFCKETSHYIGTCNRFSKETPKEKSEFVRRTGLCFGCLRRNHISKYCQKKLKCSSCNGKHPTILHDPARELKLRDTDSSESKVYSTKRYLATSKKITPYVPVRMYLNNKELVINCALDPCSSDCWLNDKLLSHFGLKPNPITTVSLTTMEGKECDIQTMMINNIQLTDMDRNCKITLPVTFTKSNDSWPFTHDDLVTHNDIDAYNFLDQVPFNFVDANIDLLVGVNVPSMTRPLEVVGGPLDQPYGTRHMMGWAFNGPIARAGNSLCHRIAVSDFVELDEKIERYFSRDFADDCNSKSLSFDDRKWLTKVEKSTKQLPNGHFEIELPLKDSVEFPCNKTQVLNMFMGLQRKLQRDPILFEKYKAFMDNMLSKNYAELVPEEDLKLKPGEYWYLHHHGVFHKVKLKLRVVFNCSLEYRNVSLNSNLHQGPDLTSNLFGVFLRFRKNEVAVVADIRQMFYQVKVPAHHSNFMRFFWFDSTGTRIVEYRLRVHVFGATSSPSIANFALKTTANSGLCSEAAKKSILHGFYVDDYVKSDYDEETSLKTVNEVSEAIAERGFHLTAYNSNSPIVLDALPKEELSKEASIHEFSEGETKTLGSVWNTKTDKLSFQFSNDSENNVTKRIMLKILSSIYDPLGLITPVHITSKKLFQEACRRQIPWDCEIPADLQKLWNKWYKNVKSVSLIEFNRCLNFTPNIKSVELHTFSDGSEAAYGAVSYVKITSSDDSICTMIVASKSRVTPLNNSTLKTIPRIELAAAKLATELSNRVKEELHCEISIEENYWSDSTTVLGYLKNDKARFQRYVANKVAFIRNFSLPEKWKYVPSANNPADLITRGATVERLKVSQLWRSGPDFLVEKNLEPFQPSYEIVTDEYNELKLDKSVLVTKSTDEDLIDRLMSSCSTWDGLRRRVASLLLLRDGLRKRRTNLKKEISLEWLIKADVEIVKYLQKKHFHQEILCIKNNTNLKKNSPLRKLNPFLDEQDVLRVGGRLANSSASFEIKHPILLPHSFQSELLLRQIHASVGHLGRESILSNLRKKYWIVRANSMARKIVNECVLCKKIQGKTGTQLMADLPSTRVQGDLPAFTNTGVDYFGPFFVSHGRKQEKRYGVIFTCMTSRAAHIEVSHSLTTDSFINALRRFIARRGNVKTITSDNGTNLTGGNTELKTAIDEWNHSVINSCMKQKSIKWIFNPPYASHHGGAYEREIRTIRKIFTSLMMEQNVKLNDEALLTLMCEVESILNCRPLTPISDDPSDLEALTPNHILLLNNFVTFPPGLFKPNDLYTKRRWRQVQYLADLFWTRWKKTYLTLLQQRQKWQTPQQNFSINDLVLVVDINLPRNMWSLGRIISINKDKSNFVRSCNVKICKSSFNAALTFDTTLITRPISKLVKLRHLD